MKHPVADDIVVTDCPTCGGVRFSIDEQGYIGQVSREDHWKLPSLGGEPENLIDLPTVPAPA